MTCGERIKEILKALGYTPEILAHDLSIDILEAQYVLENRGSMEFDVFMRIVQMLHTIKAETLFTGVGQRQVTA